MIIGDAASWAIGEFCPKPTGDIGSVERVHIDVAEVWGIFGWRWWPRIVERLSDFDTKIVINLLEGRGCGFLTMAERKWNNVNFDRIDKLTSLRIFSPAYSPSISSGPNSILPLRNTSPSSSTQHLLLGKESLVPYSCNHFASPIHHHQYYPHSRPSSPSNLSFVTSGFHKHRLLEN